MKRALLFLGILGLVATELLLLSLGFWQLNRAQEKRQLLEAYEHALTAPPLLLSHMKNSQAQHLQRISMKGIFLNDRHFLLDNQFHNHRAGYHVITPIQVVGTDKLVLLDRGWIPRGPSRMMLPNIPAIEGPVEQEGYIYKPRKQRLSLKKLPYTGWPKLIQRFDFDEITQILRQPVYPFIVKQGPEQNHGFERSWQPVLMKPEKHRAYAVQWFGLALVLLFGVIIYRRKQRAEQ